MVGPPAFRPSAVSMHEAERNIIILGLALGSYQPEGSQIAFFGPIWEYVGQQSRLGQQSAHVGLWEFFQNCAQSGRHWWAGPDPRFPWTMPDLRPPEPQFDPAGLGI